MKNIFKIYMRDLKSIFTHIGALIIVGAILILPCLYTWINLKADWDPYGKTNNVQILNSNLQKKNILRNKNFVTIVGVIVILGLLVVQSLRICEVTTFSK